MISSDVEAIDILRENLPESLSHAALFARAEVAHKWKAPFRSAILKDCLHWRLYDLAQQATQLNEAKQFLGAQILTRCALETIGMLVYLNDQIQEVISGKLDFHKFDSITRQLLLGKRLEEAKYKSINILTVLKKMDRHYPGVWRIYEMLSEGAHPNFDSTCHGYSKIDHETLTTHYSVMWNERMPTKPAGMIAASVIIFKKEYERWICLFEELEKWIVRNDAQLEATK